MYSFLMENIDSNSMVTIPFLCSYSLSLKSIVPFFLYILSRSENKGYFARMSCAYSTISGSISSVA